MNSTRLQRAALLFSFALFVGACLAEGPAHDDDASTDDDDAGADDDDASPDSPLRTQVSISSGGGSMTSPSHQARVIVGTPQPGRTSSSSHEATVGGVAR